MIYLLNSFSEREELTLYLIFFMATSRPLHSPLNTYEEFPYPIFSLKMRQLNSMTYCSAFLLTSSTTNSLKSIRLSSLLLYFLLFYFWSSVGPNSIDLLLFTFLYERFFYYFYSIMTIKSSFWGLFGWGTASVFRVYSGIYN